MIDQKQGAAAVVTRDYKPESDVCTRAVTLLLKTSTSKEAAGTSGGEDHARKELKDVSRNRTLPHH